METLIERVYAYIATHKECDTLDIVDAFPEHNVHYIGNILDDLENKNRIYSCPIKNPSMEVKEFNAL